MQTPYELLLGWRYTRAGRSSRRNGFISFISGVSMLGIALGVAALIVVLSVMNGFQKEVRDRMLGVLSHIELYAPGGAAIPAPAARMTAAVSAATSPFRPWPFRFFWSIPFMIQSPCLPNVVPCARFSSNAGQI